MISSRNCAGREVITLINQKRASEIYIFGWNPLVRLLSKKVLMLIVILILNTTMIPSIAFSQSQLVPIGSAWRAPTL